MSTEMIKRKFINRNDLRKNWETNNPTLLQGEMAIDTGETGVDVSQYKIKVGNGQDSWNNLPYTYDPSTFVKQDDFNTEIKNLNDDFNTEIQNLNNKIIEVTELPKTTQFKEKEIVTSDVDFANMTITKYRPRSFNKLKFDVSLEKDEVNNIIKNLYTEADNISGESNSMGEYNIVLYCTELNKPVGIIGFYADLQDNYYEIYSVNISKNNNSRTIYDSDTGWEINFDGIIDINQYININKYTEYADTLISVVFWKNEEKTDYANLNHILSPIVKALYEEKYNNPDINTNASYKLVRKTVGVPAVGYHKFDNKLYFNTSLSIQEVQDLLYSHFYTMFPNRTTTIQNDVSFSGNDSGSGTEKFLLFACTQKITSTNSNELYVWYESDKTDKYGFNIYYWYYYEDNWSDAVCIFDTTNGWSSNFKDETNGIIDIFDIFESSYDLLIENDIASHLYICLGGRHHPSRYVDILSDLISYDQFTNDEHTLLVDYYIYDFNTNSFIIDPNITYTYVTIAVKDPSDAYARAMYKYIKLDKNNNIVKDFGATSSYDGKESLDAFIQFDAIKYSDKLSINYYDYVYVYAMPNIAGFLNGDYDLHGISGTNIDGINVYYEKYNILYKTKVLITPTETKYGDLYYNDIVYFSIGTDSCNISRTSIKNALYWLT